MLQTYRIVYFLLVVLMQLCKWDVMLLTKNLDLRSVIFGKKWFDDKNSWVVGHILVLVFLLTFTLIFTILFINYLTFLHLVNILNLLCFLTLLQKWWFLPTISCFYFHNWYFFFMHRVWFWKRLKLFLVLTFLFKENLLGII